MTDTILDKTAQFGQGINLPSNNDPADALMSINWMADEEQGLQSAGTFSPHYLIPFLDGLHE
ncbi:MAG: hypothetical protein C4K47_10520 [Candidatus Thorarchaeota archaeon]|nr:MAG: hypothetical protein C4K47_10520 [Candidatus Thorarchaeota archaeon]